MSHGEKIRDAARNHAGDSFPVGDGDAGEVSEFAYRRRDNAGHEPLPFRPLENRLLRHSAEGDAGDAAAFGVAAHAVPAVAAVLAFPRSEHADVRLVEL